ncbi:MAG TPA: DUF3090 family protein [Acidimicrobiia bacterium]|nr:DUF3090 family protein [Acidimicrobiia bacterium]
MTDWIEFDPAERLTAGAVGPPGSRRFLIQVEQGHALLTVLVEKEQVALLSARILQLLEEFDDLLGDDVDEDDLVPPEVPPVEDGPEPLFRARLMRIGFDTVRDLMVLELFEDVPDDIEEIEEMEASGLEPELPDDLGHAARIFATPAQMRGVALRGAEAVASGRPTCRLCMLPMDPSGHDCPSKN